MDTDVFGESDGTEEKRPKQSSGQVVRRYMNYDDCEQ